MSVLWEEESPKDVLIQGGGSLFSASIIYLVMQNKLKTKLFLEEAGIATPQLIGVVKTQRNVRELGDFLAAFKSFVNKPAKGSGGKGILVIADHDGENYIKPNGTAITIADVCRHAASTIAACLVWAEMLMLQ